MNSTFTKLASGVFALGLSVGLASPAQAQYFGRMPVQWERLQFEVLKTEHFDVYHYPEEKLAAEQAGRLAERWYSRLTGLLEAGFTDRQPLILYASHPHFQQTHTIGGPPGEGTGGVTEAFKRRIVMPLGSSLAETDHVLGHELVHAFQYAMTGQGKISSSNYPGALLMPLWFIEGMAEYLSVGPIDSHTAMWLRDAARKEKLPTIRDLSNPKFFPYRYGHALWAYLAARFGDQVMGDALRAIGPRTNDAELVLKQVLGVDHEQLSKDWHAAIREANAPTLAGKQDPSRYGRALVTEKSQGGNLNVGPALSPDGSRLAFLSERDLFSVELFVADARSGDVERRLSRNLVDPHLESLQFINSAGAWDPSGKRVALGAVAKGRPVLVILDASSGKKLQEVPFPKLGEIFTPSFSPDGRQVVFSALVGGFSDLFVYDLEEGTLRRLTDDAFADLQPAFSPDGGTIAFVTDRFSTRLATLEEGNYRLGAVDVASGELRALPSSATGKNINPQWAPSGRSLYFVSDATGIANLYRLDLESGERRQLTDLLTGVSGITALSPALSSAAIADKLAYSVYDEGRYEIYTIDDGERLEGWPLGPEPARTAGLIPGGQARGAVLAARDDAEGGLPEEGFEVQPYKAKLGLDFVGQPYVSAGVGRYGATLGGGVALSFSDMLGEHQLYTVLQAENVQGLTDVGLLVAYVNSVHRFNWGAQVAQMPYITGGFASGVTTSGGRQVYVEQTLLQRQIDRTVSALGFYPLDAATRVELQTGFRNLSYKYQLTTDTFAYPSGQFIGTQEQDLESPDGLNLFQSSAALVRDTSVFGATSPVLGHRLRLELSSMVGSIDYTGALADLRQYVQPFRPLTIAGRILHYGRYGSGAEDPRLAPLFIGYQSMVRGYDTNSFSASECGAGAGCPAYDRLLGSRILVANLEARLPLFALFGAKNLYGPFPVEVGGFFDSGVAWDSGNRPDLFGGERQLVKSFGATARLNLFGFAILQVDYAKPLDRPGKSAFFQFNLLAGF